MLKTKEYLILLNAREGESVEYCHQHIKMNELRTDEDFMIQNSQAEAEAEAEFQKKSRAYGKRCYLQYSDCFSCAS